MDNKEQRTYQRSNDFSCITNISKDNKNWEEVEVFDLSSGGLKFHSNKNYEIDDKLILDIVIRGLLTEFNTRVNGNIVRKDVTSGNETYAVSFEQLKKDVAVRIDEAVKKFRPKDILH